MRINFTRWHAAISELSGSSFYQGTDPKDLGFLETFRNTSYLQIILATSRTINAKSQIKNKNQSFDL